MRAWLEGFQEPVVLWKLSLDPPFILDFLWIFSKRVFSLSKLISCLFPNDSGFIRLLESFTGFIFLKLVMDDFQSWDFVFECFCFECKSEKDTWSVFFELFSFFRLHDLELKLLISFSFEFHLSMLFKSKLSLFVGTFKYFGFSELNLDIPARLYLSISFCWNFEFLDFLTLDDFDLEDTDLRYENLRLFRRVHHKVVVRLLYNQTVALYL